MASEHVDDGVVHSMIHHAGKEIRSLKVGCMPFSNKYLLTRSCLAPLSSNQGFIGDINPINGLFVFVPRNCQDLFIESENISARSYLHFKLFVENCTNITSLSLIGLTLTDMLVSLVIKNFHKLKYLNLSGTSGISGSFLSKYHYRGTLETLILRHCFSLEEAHILMFWDLLLRKGYSMRFIRHMDISNFCGLKSGSGSYCKPKFCLDKLREMRPELTFVADFTSPTVSSDS